MVRASLAAEKAGIRSVTLVTRGFELLARRTAQIHGVPDLALAVYPGVIMTDSAEDLRHKAEETIFDQVLAGLTKALEVALIESEPGPRDIIFAGSLDEVEEYFTQRLWTDGLPVIPPTIERVEKFLKFTDRDPNEVIGVLGPENRESTVWNVAVNGVMAGCRPEYMPVLLGIADAIADPECCIHETGGTPGPEPMVMLNGPIIKELDFNSGQGVMKVGRQANTSVARFLRLYMRNIPGLRIPPGTFDKGTIGYTFNMVLAENEDAVAEVGWQPFSVDQGFEAGENVVTVRSIRVVTAPIYSAGSTAVECAEAIGDILGPTCSYSTHLGLKYRNFHPLIVISPSIARVFVKDGWRKDDLRNFLYKYCKTTARMVDKWFWRIGHTDFSLAKMVASGEAPEDFRQGSDPDRPVPVFLRPDQIGVVIAGDPDRNQARGYVPNHPKPVSRRVQLPKRWRDLLKGN
ncbi:MAG: hypothetical protein HYX92_22275 [Chloroflexi bacterium]|nr:hypothetical protein [Chloroflexota bacterium]